MTSDVLFNEIILGLKYMKPVLWNWQGGDIDLSMLKDFITQICASSKRGCC